MSQTKTIALLGQPNSGKSTLYNALTGSRQHVGNWPGKTVEQSIGTFTHGGIDYTVVDLPGTYSLAANSDEEVVTRDYIAGGEADLICILADASQLSRSMFMLADFAGIRVPAILLLNMMDVATDQGKNIDATALEKKLGIPVVPFVAADTKRYDAFYEAIGRGGAILDTHSLQEECQKAFGSAYSQLLSLLPEEGIGVYEPVWLASKLAERDPLVEGMVREVLPDETCSKLEQILTENHLTASITGNAKFSFVDKLLQGVVSEDSEASKEMNKWDKLLTSKKWGRPLAAGIVMLGLILSILLGMPFMAIGSSIPMLGAPIAQALSNAGVHPLVNSLVSEALITAVAFTFMMSGYIFGATLIFGLLEEIGLMARISYVFDGLMRRLGLHGKAVMPFLVSFGCNIAGSSASRTLDTWGQRMTAIALSWIVPCGSTWGVVALVGSTFFGSGVVLIILALLGVSALHLWITSKVFGKRFLADSDRTGLIMELPPYHKPRWGSLFKHALLRMKDAFQRAIGIISLVAILLCILSYSGNGSLNQSVLYRIGSAIEPVTMFFGLRWQMFVAWIVSAMGKEGALGALAAIFSNGSVMSAVSNMTLGTNDTSQVGATLLATISKPEALAFIFAFYFNMPCLMTLTANIHETHSVKWPVRIALYYIGMSLLLSCAVYHITGLFW